MNRNPYQPVGDFLSNISRFQIIESTLREGEQFANAYFDTETKIAIARALDEFGADYVSHIYRYSCGLAESNCSIDRSNKSSCFRAVKTRLRGDMQARLEEVQGLSGDILIPGAATDIPQILTHIRCHMDDARIAVETGVDGV